MKHFIRCSLGAALLVALTQAGFGAETRPAGFVDFGKLNAAPGCEFVEVNVGSSLISMAARLVKGEPEIAEVLQGLKSIRVNVVGLSDENRTEIEDHVKHIRTQLNSGGWERIVTVQKDKEDVGIYLKARGAEAVEGIVVTVLNGNKQAVLINIVGDIKPEKLGVLGERFNIDPLKELGPGLAKKHAEEE